MIASHREVINNNAPKIHSVSNDIFKRGTVLNISGYVCSVGQVICLPDDTVCV